MGARFLDSGSQDRLIVTSTGKGVFTDGRREFLRLGAPKSKVIDAFDLICHNLLDKYK